MKRFALNVWSKIINHRYAQALMRYLFDCSSYGDIHAARVAKRLTLVVAYLIILFVSIGVALGIAPDWSFREGDPMTMLSVFFLFVIGHFCFRIRDLVSSDVKSAAVWKVLGITFVFLGFDDWLRIHETIDHTFHKIFRIHETEFTDHLDDTIVGLYGVIVLIILWRGRRQLLRYLCAMPYFIPGAVFAVSHVLMDFLVSSRSIIGQFVSSPEALETAIISLEIVEETFKLFAEVFLVAAIVHCFTLDRDRQHARKC